MKTNILSLEGKKIREVKTPKFFLEKVREDLISKVLEAKKSIQPYGPSPVAGKQHSASGILIHRRHVWKSQYGRGISRIPRKIMLRRGSQFQQIGAESPNTRGGRRAHPPKVVSMINTKKINKKEMNLAFISAISATANEKIISKKYERLNEEKIQNLPFVVESKVSNIKTKELLSALKKILGEKIFEVSLRKKDVRSGKGKMRGRKYKTHAGLLMVVGKKEGPKTNAIEVKEVNNLSINDLARGGPGRITLYTEKAIEELQKKFKDLEKENKEKVK